MRNTIFPAYVVIDFSESMKRFVDSNGKRTRIDVAKDIIPTLLESMKKDASVAESLRVRVIGFNQSIIFCTELFDYYELNQWYEREKSSFESKCNWQTWYGSVFDKLYECINKDVNSIAGEGKGYYRPLVYFLTDGIPEGENPADRDKKYQNLVNNRDSHRNPVIFCVGIGTEDMSTLKQYGASSLGSNNGEYQTHNNKMTFIIKKGVKTGDALEVLNENVVETIKYSLQQRVGASGKSNKIDIDTSGIDDEDVAAKLITFFERDRLS